MSLCLIKISFSHYPIRSQIKASGKKEYAVGIRGEVWYSSISNLVVSYSTYSYFHKHDNTLDCFPWWIDNKENEDDINYY